MLLLLQRRCLASGWLRNRGRRRQRGSGRGGRREGASVGVDVAAACRTPVVRARGRAWAQSEVKEEGTVQGRKRQGQGPGLRAAAAAAWPWSVEEYWPPAPGSLHGRGDNASKRSVKLFLFLYFFFENKIENGNFGNETISIIWKHRKRKFDTKITPVRIEI